MKTSFKLKALAIAVAALAGTQSAHALVPWTDTTPDLKIYTSGGAAQDKAYASAVINVLAEPGTVDSFEDDNAGTVGGRFAGYYFVGRSTAGPGGIPAALPAGLAGKKIYLEKRSLGAAGYGVVPLAGNIALDHLDIFLASSNGLAGSGQAAAWLANGTNKYKSAASIVTGIAGQGAWGNYLISTVSDGGFIGVDAEALLQPGTQNYPAPIKELSTNLVTAPWPTTLKVTDLAAARIPTGGLVYGIGVTLDLYKALQIAQWKTGQLPADAGTKIGEYTDPKYIPSLSRNFLASLLSGQVTNWANVQFRDIVTNPSTPAVYSLSQIPTIAGYPALAAPTKYTVGVGRRNTGAAIGAVGYAKLLNYPFTPNSFAPAVDTGSLVKATAEPYVTSPGGAAATDNLLKDWQAGTNVSTLNYSATGRLWGFALHSGDRNAAAANATPTQNWRYIKIDGYTGTIDNVASGNYPYWAEGEVLIQPTIGTDKTNLLTAFGNALHNTAVAADINPTLVQPYGQSGIFATSKTDNTNTTANVPFNVADPVVNLTHFNGTSTHLGIVPKPFKNAASTAIVLELQ
jgi:hypothetical protein